MSDHVNAARELPPNPRSAADILRDNTQDMIDAAVLKERKRCTEIIWSFNYPGRVFLLSRIVAKIEEGGVRSVVLYRT